MTSLKQVVRKPVTLRRSAITDQAETRSSSRIATRHAWWLVLLCFIVMASCHCARAATEAQVKAAFIYNFARFVEWPPQSFASDDAPLTIGVMGGSPIADTLDQITKGKTIGGRRLAIKRLGSGDSPDGCHILFIGASEKARTGAILEKLRDSSVVTVGETGGFMRSGGVIGFVIENSKVAFEINAGAAKRKRLKISSQLLKLAKNVKD